MGARSLAAATFPVRAAKTNAIFRLAAGLQAVGQADPRFLFSTINPVSPQSRRALPTLAQRRRLTRR